MAIPSFKSTIEKNSVQIATKDLLWQNDKNIITNDKAKLWLLDDTSLTAKLKVKYLLFEVQLLFEKYSTPHTNEIEVLVANNIPTYVREVILCGNHKPIVFAHSVIPETKDTHHLLARGNSPLGEKLFAEKKLVRKILQFTKSKEGIWGRRSVFILGSTRLLVCEFFLNALYD